jgi:GGDEF domain-containing protein
MLVCFSMVFVAILFWAIPWLPYGFSVEDYDSRLMLLVGLIVIASITAFGTVYHRDLGRNIEQTLATWTTVHDGLGDLRRREYFYDRIVIECDRAAGNGSQFAVVTMRLDTADKGDKKLNQLSGQAVSILLPLAKESDCLSVLGPREIGILAPDVDVRQAPGFAEKLRSLVIEGVDNPGTEVRVGWAVYGVDAMEAGGLVGFARERLQGKHRPTEAMLERPDYPKTA